ncbi:MAG: MarR family winged helix-turn-helix transcriptional regulator [Pseudomonadota bacterium]
MTETPVLLVNQELQAKLANASLQHFRVIISSVKKHMSDTESACGISSSQLWVLYELNRAPDLKVSELAANLSIHQSTASNLIEKLVKKKLILKKRETSDQRVVRLSLTEQGLVLIQNAPPSPRGVLRDALDRLEMETLITLTESLAQLSLQISGKNLDAGLIPISDL